MTSDPTAILGASFAEACHACPDQVTDGRFTVGGAVVSARVAGTGLARSLRRSLAPAIDVHGGRGMKLELWDEAATGVALPALVRPAGEVGQVNAHGESIAISDDGHTVRHSGPDFETRMDLRTQHAVGWVRSEQLLPPWHRVRPLQALLLLWMVQRGVTAAHAAMVAREGIGIVLAGPEYSGKSTTMAACAASGFDLLGDDAIGLEIRDGRALGHCVHAAVKLRSMGIERHPTLIGQTEDFGPPWEGEAVAFLGDAFPGQAGLVASKSTERGGFEPPMD